MQDDARLWVRWAALVVLLLLFFPAPAEAQNPPPQNPPADQNSSPFIGPYLKSGQICPVYQNENNTTREIVVERLVKCLTSPNPLANGIQKGLIPAAIDNFFKNPTLNTYMTSYGTGFILLATVIFGVQLVIGATQHPLRDAWVLLLKAGAVLFFMKSGSFIFDNVLQMVDGFLQVIAIAMNGGVFADTMLGSGMAALGNMLGSDGLFFACPNNSALGGQAEHTIWLVWDCFLWQLTGAAGLTLIAGGVLAVAVLILVATLVGNIAGFGLALGIVAMVVYIAIKLVSLAVRVLHIYLMAIIGLGFMLSVGFLFVPLILFQGTKPYFDRWLQISIGYILTPMALMAFVGIALMCINTALFTGQYSILHSLLGSNMDVNRDEIKLTSDKFLLSDEKSAIHLFRTSEDVQAAKNTGDAVNTGVPGVAQQIEGDVQSQTGAQDVRIPMKALDVAAWAENFGLSVIDFIKHLFISTVAATLMIYILYNIAEHIPELVNGLIIGGYNAGAIATERAMGEVGAQVAAMVAIETARAILTGGVAVGMRELVDPNSRTRTQARQALNGVHAGELR
jgi:type IV secretory pathway VirB6-like protein